MKLWWLIIIIVLTYIINNFCYIKVRNKYGDSDFSKKMSDNSKNIISCIMGIIFIILAVNLWNFIKWPLIIFYSLAFAYEFIVAFLITIILQIYLIFKKEYIEKESWYVILSNLISSLCYGLMAYSIFKFLF